MGKFFKRLKRIFDRARSPLSKLQKAGKVILGLLGVAGVGTAILNREALISWLKADWTHGTVVVLVVVAVGLFLSVWNAEAEAEARTVVQLKNFGATSTYYPHFELSTTFRSLSEVLVIKYHCELRNDSDRDTWVYPPEVQIFRREARKWLPISLEVKGNAAAMAPKGTPLIPFSGNAESCLIRSRSVVSGEFEVCALRASKVVCKALRLRVAFDVGGQPPVTAETDLTVMNAPPESA